MKWTEAQKQEALRILAEDGPAEASRRTGVPIGTIASWGHRLGIKAPPVASIERCVAAASVEWAKRKLALGEQLGGIAAKAADRIEQRLDADRTTGIRDLAASMAVLIDRAQLLTGGATSRSEIVERTPENEAEVAKVLELVRSSAA